MNLKGKTVILTGARRIGQTVAEELAKKGANLAITYRTAKEESEGMCVACLQAGVKAVPFQADLSNPKDIKKLVADVKAQFGSIDVLIHMAAPYPKVAWEDLNEEAWNFSMNSIGKSTFLLGKLVGDSMLENSGDDVEVAGESVGKIKGKIITFSDWSVLTSPYKEYLPYNASKAAVEGLTRSFAKALAPSITVNGIAPGPILRPPDLNEEENKEALGRTPLKHWGGAQEIAKAVLYLLDADFITGVILPVDGGRTIG
jgi:NAD(P)-dependent dehydrogenase (short-subunit alcohol dehydrogenase family)